MSEGTTAHGGSHASGNGCYEALEGRVHRLEDAVGALQDTRQLEERLVDRVDRLQPSTPAHLLVDAKRVWLPATPSPPEAIPAVPVAQPWFFLDAYQEAKTFFRMFADTRYRVSRGVWPLTLALLIGIGTSQLWFPIAYLPWLGPYLDKALDLVLAFFLYKVLSREARRYKATFPDG